MKELIQSNDITMSSREIAELLGKNHSDIKRSALRLESKNLLSQPLAEFDYLHNGNTYQEYKLNKRDSILLVAQNCPEFTAAIVDRWQELEASQAPTPPAFQIPQTLAEALQLAADQAKQLELQAPKVAFVEKLVERKTLLTATQVAQKHKLSAIKLNKMLDEIGGVYSQAVKRKRVFTQPWVDKGYGEMKQTELGHDQALFTPAGEVRIHEILISEGIV